ncbi:MAG: hypothetical protein AB9866_06540 [Syntrophobacteraceae bacterium]
MKKSYIWLSGLSLFFIGMLLTEVYKPVHTTVSDCVSNGVLYSLPQSGSETIQPSLVASPLKVNGLSLKQYEGMEVRIEGYLHSSDRFNPIADTLKILGPCDERSATAISAR